MKRWMYIIGILICAILAYWAYSISSETRMASIELRSLKSEIRKEHERISVLRSEWAYLNRPERLRHLVELNFDKLGLVQITEQNYGETSVVPFASQEALDELPEINDSELEQILAEIETTTSEDGQ